MKLSLEVEQILPSRRLYSVSTLIEQPTETSVELRCPLGAKKLLAVVRSSGEYHSMVEGNLLELACRDCKYILAKERGKKPQFVLHRFNVLGQLVESEIVWPDLPA